MQRILTKKMNKTPVRSPSPDIANKNIIVKTVSPLKEALTKLRQSKSSKSPMGRGFCDSDQYQAYIKSLQERIRLLSEENSIIKHENANKSQQIEFLKDMNYKYRKEASNRSDSQLSYRSDNQSPYQLRITEMSKQITRMHDILAKDQSTIQKLQKQNEEIRNQTPFTVRSLRTSSFDDRNANKDFSKELSAIEHQLNTAFNRRLAQYQNKVEDALEEFIKKLNKIQKEQKAIVKLVQRQKSMISPVNTGKGRDHQTYSPYSPSPQTTKRSKEMRTSRQIQCQNCRIYLQRIAQLEAQLNVKSFNVQHSSKSINKKTVPLTYLQEYIEKLQEIKMILNNQQIEESINHIENNLNDIFSIEEKFEYMKEQKNSIIQQLREKQVQQSLEIVKLKKENELFKAQIKQQMEEIQKLQELITTKAAEPKRQQATAKRKNVTNDGNILRKYIMEAIERIQSLESQIGDTLHS